MNINWLSSKHVRPFLHVCEFFNSFIPYSEELQGEIELWTFSWRTVILLMVQAWIFFFFNLEDSDKILQNATVNIDFLITVLIHVFCA